MSRTRIAVQNTLQALQTDAYDIGVLSERGMLPGLSGLASAEVIARIPMLRAHNARGAHIYIRSSGEHRYTLLDDLGPGSLARMSAEGFEPALVVETSPGNYQAWLKHSRILPKEMSTLAAQLLAQRFGADGGAADWRHFGRLPGFTNVKPKYQRADGLYPYVLLRQHSGRQFRTAETFAAKLIEKQQAREHQPATPTPNHPGFLSPHEGERYSHLSVSRFRALPRYHRMPAKADMAFCVTALALGMPESEVAGALSAEYLSRDSNPARKIAYVKRTLAAANAWTTRCRPKHKAHTNGMDVKEGTHA